MKIAFTVSGSDLSSAMDVRFGRAPKFLIYDLDSDKFEVVDNQQNLNAVQGAGIQSAEKVVNLGAKAVITGHCGPKAFRVLSSAGVKVYTTEELTASSALQAFKAGKLKEISGADVEGHW